MDKDRLIVLLIRFIAVVICVYLMQSFVNASFSVIAWGALGRLASVVLLAAGMVAFHKYIDNG